MPHLLLLTLLGDGARLWFGGVWEEVSVLPVLISQVGMLAPECSTVNAWFNPGTGNVSFILTRNAWAEIRQSWLPELR